MDPINWNWRYAAAIVVGAIGVMYIGFLIWGEDDSHPYFDKYGSPCPERKVPPGSIRVSLNKSSLLQCSFNPIIDGQMRKMLGKSRKNGELEDLPNLGSVYLGASVATTRNTKLYKHPNGADASAETNTPDLVLDPGPVLVGKNWHFIGVGTLVVKLFRPAYISGVSIVHPSVTRFHKGEEKSAPKAFTVVGMNHVSGNESFTFGKYAYNINGSSLQTFPVQSCSVTKYQFIEFQFTSNHGNPHYTALYNVRIHGDMPMAEPTAVTKEFNSSSKPVTDGKRSIEKEKEPPPADRASNKYLVL